MALDPQNKVDRAALPPQSERRPDSAIPYSPPRGDQEREVAVIWAEILGIDRVGIHDNFSDVGGNSLAATKIVERVLDRFGLNLPLQDLLDSPTVEKMARVITQKQSLSQKSGLRSSRFGCALPHACVESTEFKLVSREDLEQSIPARFEKIVRLYPNNIAIKAGNQSITYAGLNAMANRAAHSIIAQRGTEPEPVGLLLDKGVEQIAAMLAVFKTGKFVVLLDPSFPLERNLAIVKETSPALILTDTANTGYATRLADSDATVFGIESIDPGSDAGDLDLEISPDALAYVVYTSGTTGQPKGVIQNHRNQLHFLKLYTNLLGITPNDRYILLTSGTANTLGNSLYALLTGATLHPFNVHALGPAKLAGYLMEEKISVCAISTLLFRRLCESLTGRETFPDLRILRLTSEASYKSDFELYKRFFPRTCRLVNMLLPTESGTLRCFLMDHQTQIITDEIPLGYPVEDKEISLLDDEGREVGFGEVGEIVVRSRFLSPGYWLRPDLNEVKFKLDPRDPTQRVYYTGDLGVMLPGGCLIHKGRKDLRLKIRGYGVDLAEVERVLRGHHAIEDAVVVGRTNAAREASLIAYFTSAPEQIPTTSELRQFLSKTVPDYMIPAVFIRLETFPLTPNGKVDRKALPDVDRQRPQLSQPYAPPRNQVERMLVKTWEAVLDVKPIGINDNFFDLGGDSLSATRVITKLLRNFQWEFPVQAFFQHPTIAAAALIAERQANLPEDDQPIDATVASALPISPQSVLSLSYPQQRLWFLDRLDPGSCAYNLFSAYRLRGSLNVSALEGSFNEIIRRHEVLRTVFQSEDGNPIQVVLPHVTISAPLIDLRSPGSAEERWRRVRRRCTQEAQRPFDLTTGPLIRVTLLQLADDEHVLLQTMHHIVSDGWSEGALFHQLSELYNAFSAGQPSPLADLPAQYADYAGWQRQWFVGERLESQLTYWKKQLDNIATLHLPTDRRRKASQGTAGGRRYFALSDELSSNLKKLSRQHRTTLFMTLLAAYQTLLHRYSNQTDIAIGSPVAGRNSKEFDDLIGFFLNMLVLRLDLSGDPTFAETIARAREVCLGALTHQELPFEKLVEELHPDRELGQNPLFQVTFAFQNSPRVPLQLSGIEVEQLEVETGIARFDLHLFMEETDGHLKGYCDYDANLFNGDTIERMLGHFKTLLEGVVADPGQRISELPLLSATEQRQLLGWSKAQTVYRTEKCLHQLFEEQARRTPEAVAVVFEGEEVTYDALDRRANSAARALKELGVGPDVLVGLNVERSVELVIGILGILKAGGAYVPLDPSYPKERLDYMVRDSAARVIVMQRHLAGGISTQGAAVLWVGAEQRRAIVEEPAGASDLERSVRPENPAYVIYTSGSTGTPKGVVVAHRNVVRLFQATQDRFNFTSSDVWSLFHSCAFDFSVWEMWGALLNGGRLIVVPPAVTRSPQDFAALMKQSGVTVLNQTPSAFRQLMPYFVEMGPTERTTLRYVIFGGEALDLRSLRPWFDRYGDDAPKLINMYGITETTVHVTYRQIAATDPDSATGSMIGSPIPDLSVYVLDGNGQMQPTGIPGEIYVGGDGVATGYLGKPELTMQRFVADRYGADHQARLYRSGDLARWLPSGELEYLGRTDDQVKIRGYRVEPGEIEAVLGEHPAIRQVAVAAREDTLGDKRLVGYLVARPESSFDPGEARSYLKGKLPDHMIPSAWVFLEVLPLTPNGKIDRKALPAWDHDRLELRATYRAPRTAVEKTLADIWSEVLRVGNVGIHDNFFDLGGHSLLITQVIVRACKAFGVDVPLRTVFESPTIEQLADAIARIRALARSREEWDVVVGGKN